MKRKEEHNKIKGFRINMAQIRDTTILIVIFVFLVRMMESLYVGAEEIPENTLSGKLLTELPINTTDTIKTSISNTNYVSSYEDSGEEYSSSKEDSSSEEDHFSEEVTSDLDYYTSDYYDNLNTDSRLEESSGNFDETKHSITDIMTDSIVSKNSAYCNWTAPLGPVCKYNNSNQVVVIPAGLMLNPGKLELEIHDAKVVHVYPACVSWVQIFNAELVTTMMDNKNSIDCRTWLRIYGSVADFVVNGVKDLTLIDSEIYTIRLSNQRDFMAINSVIHNIERLEWRGYRGTIRNSSVGIIRSMEANDNFYIVDSQIKQILSNGILFDSKEFKISNSSVHEVYENGINVVSGAVTLENVEFNMVQGNAIVVTGDTAFLKLVDIKIHKADKPCIILPARGRVSFKNVTINNENVTESSPYVHYTDDRSIDVNYEGPIIYAEKSQGGCNVKDTQLICDFTENKELIKISQDRLDEFSSVKVIGSDKVYIDPLCTTDLSLEKVTGTLIHTNMSMKAKSSHGHEDEDRPCGMGVTIDNSTIDIISCKAIKTIDLLNTRVKRLHTGMLSHLNLMNVSVDHLVDFAFNGKEGIFRNVNIQSLANITFFGPMKMDMMFVKDIMENSLTFDHPNETSVLTNVHLRKLHKGSIVVKHGTLKIVDCFVVAVQPMAFIIEDEGRIELDGCFFLTNAKHVVSVESESQAIILGQSTEFLHIRSNASTLGHNNHTILNIDSSNPHCTRKVLQWYLFCDFAGVNISLDIKLKSRQMIIMKNVHSVDIYPSLLIKLILNNVVKATTMESEDGFSFWLEGNNVTFDRIHTGVHDITIRNSRIKLLSPDRQLVDVDLENTVIDKIDGLSWKGYEGVFNNVTIGEVAGMQVHGLFTMNGSHIGKISNYGMTINDNGNIINSTLGHIESGGIKIGGAMHIIDVVIDTLERESIVVTGGTLLLKNVIIKNATEYSIMAVNKGGVSFENVTIGGSDIVLHGYYTKIGSEENPNNQSFVLFNRPKSAKSTDVSIPATKSPSAKPTIGPTIPRKEITPKANIEPSSDFSKEPRFANAESSAQSWGWAGAGTGFLCGILIGCALLMVVKLFRSGDRKSFLPLVLWQVKDDQNELITSPSARNSVVSQDGYSTLPNTDDRSETFTI